MVDDREGKVERKFGCWICKQTFNNPALLKEHQQFKHPEEYYALIKKREGMREK